MKNCSFYKELDVKLAEIVKEFTPELNNRLKQDQQKKSYALLIWFLRFYSNISNIEEYITDGDDDASCDIILDMLDSQGSKTFYIVQSKWNSESNCDGSLDTTELKSFLSDAQIVLKGEKSDTKNEKFNVRNSQLKEHIRANGQTKAIFLTLKNKPKQAVENIKSTRNAIGGNVDIEIFDINRIKTDFINRNFKGSSPPNPLSNVYSPEYEKIKIQVSRDSSADENHIHLSRPFEAYVFTIKPSMIYRLVERYGVSLFDKNVRNPLLDSSINTEIENSVLNNPSYFWYYNNGITAITRSLPSINSKATEFEVTGLQIINGAQTAYSIYSALKDCAPEKRNIIDEEARITFRLLKSGGKEFDLRVTKFTNSQNPVSDRDFWSNDPVQEKIQEYFYETNTWYERRNGEFRKTPKDIVVVPNTIIASAYLAFWLGDAVAVFDAAMKRSPNTNDMIFTSQKDNDKGLYEKIFNDKTDVKAVYAAFCMLDAIRLDKRFDPSFIFFSNAFHALAASKVVLRKYLQAKYGKSMNIVEFIIRKHNEGSREILVKVVSYAVELMKNHAGDEKSERQKNLISLMTKKSHFDIFLEELESKKISAEDVESAEIKTEEDDDDDDDLENMGLESLESTEPEEEEIE